ncbi:hypothetical protein OIU85_004514, partial [Salix viminalis]
MGCRNLLRLSCLPNSLPHGLPAKFTTSRAAEPCCGLTMPIGLPLPTVLDAALLVSTDMDMACSMLLQQASSPTVQ